MIRHVSKSFLPMINRSFPATKSSCSQSVVSRIFQRSIRTIHSEYKMVDANEWQKFCDKTAELEQLVKDIEKLDKKIKRTMPLVFGAGILVGVAGNSLYAAHFNARS